MKKIILSLLLLCLAKNYANAQANTYYMGPDPAPFYNNTTITTCKGVSGVEIYDDGTGTGAAYYADGDNLVLTFCSGGGPIKINVTLADIASGDHLYIHDGPLATSTQIGNITNVSTTLGQAFTSSGTCLTLVFKSNNDGVVGEGFSAIIGCQPTGCGGNPVAGDNCATAPVICDLNSYCGNTSGWYTADNENIATGEGYGAFDDYQYYGTQFTEGNSTFCGSIENNSWIAFVAGATNPKISMTSSNCVDGSSGIQAVMLSASGCSSFNQVSTSCISQGSGPGSFTLTGSGLTIGQTYYVMIDGFAGNYCDYQITNFTGVQVYSISSSTTTVCANASATLSITPTNATSYAWTASTGGAITGSTTGSSITATPSVTTTYSCAIVGNTGCTTTLTQVITVTSAPTLTLSAPSYTTCLNVPVVFGASGTTTYTWTPTTGMTG
ncbi:MAG TPA: hypothetical protein VK835_08890, partial [Bacteroidia bacterium]|nr:hypothetical protein [Bacteroidia bacterium]